MSHRVVEERFLKVTAFRAAISKPNKPPKPTAISKKAPVTQLDGNKWIIVCFALIRVVEARC